MKVFGKSIFLGDYIYHLVTEYIQSESRITYRESILSVISRWTLETLRSQTVSVRSVMMLVDLNY